MFIFKTTLFQILRKIQLDYEYEQECFLATFFIKFKMKCKKFSPAIFSLRVPTLAGDLGVRIEMTERWKGSK